MPKKSTVTVQISWFSSGPIFRDALAAVKDEIRERRVLTKEAHAELTELQVLNGGEPFAGETQWGPHTRLNFEAKSLVSAVSAAETIREFLVHRFPEGMGRGTGGVHIRFAGRTLMQILASLETALVDADPDLRGTRRFLPSMRIKTLRKNLEAIYA